MFMAAIERITSKKRRIKVPGSANRWITTNVWNETVANLTLMALGSSAPEILLAINDIFKNKFHAGELGPSTIVGSAAFNLFVIIAVCINAIPAGETRQIKETGVFFITAFFSVIAYLWLLFIVEIHTPDIVGMEEGILTFLFMPVLVWVSYASDAGIFDAFYEKYLKKKEKKGTEIEDKEHSKGAGALGQDLFSPRALEKRGKDALYIGQADNDNDPTEEQNGEEEVPAVYRCLECCCGAFTKCCRLFSKCLCIGLCFVCNKLRRKRQKKEEVALEDLEEAAIDEVEEADLEDPDTVILDEEGEPIECEEGILTFTTDSIEVTGDLEEQQYQVVVLRKNGLEGRVSCKYRMEKLTATPGYDYVDEEGVVDFRNGIARAEIEITILPKEIGEKNDQFQIILEESNNGAIFNPNSDGGEDQCLLTITILNANPATSRMAKLFGIIDGWLNMDDVRQGSAAWYDQVVEAYYCNGSPEAQEEARFLDWVMHIIIFPWNMTYALMTPPPPYLGGWVCFVVALMHIGVLTAIIGDMAELFGCAADIPDNITAITVVALGTSLPDLFASKAAATGDEWADASIVNVTGSNSVNVFLGIGLPWMMAAIYWHITDGTADSLWMEKYESKFIERCPTGCFVVESGDLTFSVVVFTVGALVCLTVIRIRRVVYDGELGGPSGSDSKACSSFLLVCLWIFYIGLSIWKSVSGVDNWPIQIMAIATCIPVLVLLMIWFGFMLQLLRISKDYIGEEGFFGIAVAVSIMVVRMVYFLMFQ